MSREIPELEMWQLGNLKPTESVQFHCISYLAKHGEIDSMLRQQPAAKLLQNER